MNRCIDVYGNERPQGHIRIPQYPGRCARCGSEVRQQDRRHTNFS